LLEKNPLFVFPESGKTWGNLQHRVEFATTGIGSGNGMQIGGPLTKRVFHGGTVHLLLGWAGEGQNALPAVALVK